MQDKDKFYFIHHLNATTDVAFYIQNNFNNVLLVSLFFAFFFLGGSGEKKSVPHHNALGNLPDFKAPFIHLIFFFIFFSFFSFFL